MGGGIKDAYESLEADEGKVAKEVLAGTTDETVGALLKTMSRAISQLNTEALSKQGWRHVNNLEQILRTLYNAN